MYGETEDTPLATRLGFPARSRWLPRDRKQRLVLALLLCGIVGVFLIVLALKGDAGAGKQSAPSLIYTGCVTPYGYEAGLVDGVAAYSNWCGRAHAAPNRHVNIPALVIPAIIQRALPVCSNDSYVSDEENFEDFGNPEPTFTGMKWQCVEYARRYAADTTGSRNGAALPRRRRIASAPCRWGGRYLMVTRGVQFGSVDGASDIWALQQERSSSVKRRPRGAIISRRHGRRYNGPGLRFFFCKVCFALLCLFVCFSAPVCCTGDVRERVSSAVVRAKGALTRSTLTEAAPHPGKPTV